jgi:hypothetical protein
VRPVVAILCLVLGCSSAGELAAPARPLTPPLSLCDDWNERPACLDARDAEHRLQRPDLEILGASDAPAGKQGAQVLTLGVDDGAGRVVFRAKWRAHSTSHALNRPRHEVAAFALAKLLFEPSDCVIPPTSSHCFELTPYREHVDPSAVPSFPEITCVFGVLSLWLEDARDTSEPMDTELFWQSAAYRESLAGVNLLAYLIAHGDSHAGQFVLTGAERAPRVHLIDNTIAFSAYRNPSIVAEESWSRLRVPALPEALLARLARLGARDFAALAVIEQLENRGGMLVPVQPGPAAGDRSVGLRWVGSALQVGLTSREIADLYARARAIVDRAARGELATFR